MDNKIANVEEIKIRATIVRRRVNERMIIPNSHFLEEKFVNRSYSDRKLRIPVKVQVAYGSDVELVEKILYESVFELKKELWANIIGEPKPVFFLKILENLGLILAFGFGKIHKVTKENLEFQAICDLKSSKNLQKII